MALPLSKPVFDHCPCVISIRTSIPKPQIFIFENYWLRHHDFKDIVEENWNQSLSESDSAKLITAKFKRLRKCLKIWARSVSQLSISIKATNEVILFLDSLEDFRNLTDVESNGRTFLATSHEPTTVAKNLLAAEGHNKMG